MTFGLQNYAFLPIYTIIIYYDFNHTHTETLRFDTTFFTPKPRHYAAQKRNCTKYLCMWQVLCNFVANYE